jgi:hypothetical protein
MVLSEVFIWFAVSFYRGVLNLQTGIASNSSTLIMEITASVENGRKNARKN